MRVRSENGSRAARPSRTTRVMIAPTLRQAIRMSSATVCFGECVTSQATWSSKSLVCPAPWRAQGTWATVTPWVGQSTLGESASR